MTYKTSVTKKGQMTIPKKLRDALGIDKNTQVEIELDQKNKVLKVKNIPDISEVKGMIKNPKGGVMKAREKMEEEYKRE